MNKLFWGLGIGDWGLGDWGLAQSPIPNPTPFTKNPFLKLFQIQYIIYY